MRIGITTTMQHSVFSGGLHGQAIAMAEALRPFGTVDLINRTEQTWWDDCESVKAAWKVVPIKDASGYDLCVECGPPLASTERFATKHVWITNNFLIREIEQSIFPVMATKRDLSGLAEIWTTDTDIQALQILTGLPVKTIPFVWSPTFIKAYSTDAPWTPGPWKIHCIETHTSNTSSCVLPLVIAREISKETPIESVRLHNAESIAKAQFFQENTLRLCTDLGLKVDVFGRQRFADWLQEPGSCVIAHSRFKPIRTGLLDLLWCGIPFIHNSPMLADAGFRDTYYHENQIGAAVKAFRSLATPDRKRNREILARWSPEAARPAFSALVDPAFRIGFCDMWADFNPAYNFFTLLLKHVAPHLTITGGVAQGDDDIVIFGPFGKAWKSLPPGQPKIHFTGENTPPVPEAQLNLGFQHNYMIGDNYLRFPLWLLEIDWFGADSRIRNPIPIPLEICTKAPTGPRDRFCAFIVSNPVNPVRNAAFKTLNAWKPVDSAGTLFNNIGPQLFAGQGGGGGEARKVEFLKNYRFCIAYENAASPGYCTEKLLHAKAAGCVPIYWGDPYVERDFDPNGFIDARNFRTPKELVAAVRRVEENPKLWAAMAAVPALSEYKVEWARRTMAELGKRLLALGKASKQPETYVINLDRRPDRLKRLGVQATRWPAVDGRSLELTPGLRNLLANNDFFWKKAVAGCALSHLGLWTKLAKSDASGYLILEDDVVLEPGWNDAWNRIEIPDDTDIIYLGGVLPPNREAFSTVLEPVCQGLSRVKVNQLFGPPSRYFHFCAYAYYLTRSGSRKILEAVSARGIWTSADHILCNPSLLNAYVMTPTVAGCYQDADPVYQASKFNDFSRVDNFDSDLWNNNERFVEPPISDIPFACVEPLDLSGLYEYEWLCELFGNPRVVAVATLDAAPPNPIIIVQGPYLQKTLDVLSTWTRPFRILHLSDERLQDPVDFYDHPCCKGVIRNYARPGKALTIPLGYHWHPIGNSVPKLPFRTKTWSFVGTEWGARGELHQLPKEKSVLRLFPKWQDPENLGKSEYLELLLDSIFAPCPAGQNAETFRIYEALECGAVPLIIGPCPVALPLLPLESWIQAGECMTYFLANKERLEEYRDKLFAAWTTLKNDLKKSIQNI